METATVPTESPIIHPFRKIKPCPKCGSNMNISYHNNKVLVSKYCQDVGGEHLHRFCGSCSYSLLMRTKDFKDNF